MPRPLRRLSRRVRPSRRQDPRACTVGLPALRRPGDSEWQQFAQLALPTLAARPICSISVKRSSKRRLSRLWGYGVLLVVIIAWFGRVVGPGWIAGLSVAVLLYALFQAPMWCRAQTREGGLCRNNAYGILFGCHLNEHKWQKLKMAGNAHKWGELFRRVLNGIGGWSATVGALAASVSAIAAVAALLMKK